MNDAKRNAKENIIIDAAERVFSVVGFKNAKMENIASEAGITKVTLYSYFQSKENLYLLDYFAMVRSTSAGKDTTKLTEATKESIYYTKLQDIQNLPFKLSVKEIERGQRDGSIISRLDPMVQTLHGWSTVIGYAKVITASGDHATPLFNVSLKDIKQLNLGVARALLGSTQLHAQLESA